MKYTIDSDKKIISIQEASSEDIIKLANQYKDYTFKMEIINNFSSPYNYKSYNTKDYDVIDQFKIYS